jgi:uncharacterized protein
MLLEEYNMNKYILNLDKILTENNVCKSHGINHALAVLNNAVKATVNSQLSEQDKKLIYIASLLHDADDYKFFKNNDKYFNLKNIMLDCGNSDEEIEIVIKMVDLVSSSKNRDNIPIDIPLWYVIPRYADRIEAIGLIGIIRCAQYNKTINAIIYNNNTPKLKSKEEIINYIMNDKNKQRYFNYKGKSASMIDHFYDKLLYTTYFPIKNIFFDLMCEKGREVLLNFLIFFANTLESNKQFTYDDIDLFIKNVM